MDREEKMENEKKETGKKRIKFKVICKKAFCREDNTGKVEVASVMKFDLLKCL